MRQPQLQANFEGWQLPTGEILRSKFIVALIGEPSGKWAYRYKAVLCPSMQPFSDKTGKPLSFAESKLEEAKETIRKMFETQVSDWQ